MFDFDVEQILKDQEVVVEWADTIVDVEGNESRSDHPGWSLCWRHGFCHIGNCPEDAAREAAALFAYLYQVKDVSAQMAIHLARAVVFKDMYVEAVEHYQSFINDIEHYVREGHDNVLGSLRIRL